MLRKFVLPWLVWAIYRLWSWTWRLECLEPEGLQAARAERKPLIFAHWHGDELCIVPLLKPYSIATMTSTSKDGELMDFVIRKFGGLTSRGSSTRGGVSALKGLIRLVKKQGRNASMAVDGPKGPIYKVKPGIFELAYLTQGQIVAMGVATKRSFIFEKSWNKAKLPKPFARIVVQFGEPWANLVDTQDFRSKELASRLENEIARACQSALRHLP